MDKKNEILRESVRKLFGAGAGDEEVRQSLLELGISNDDAKKIMAEAKEAMGRKVPLATTPSNAPIQPEKSGKAVQQPPDSLEKKLEEMASKGAASQEGSKQQPAKKTSVDSKAMSASGPQGNASAPGNAGKENFWDSSRDEFWKVKEKKNGFSIPFLTKGNKQGQAPATPQATVGSQKQKQGKSLFGFLAKKPKVREIIVKSPLEDKFRQKPAASGQNMYDKPLTSTAQPAAISETAGKNVADLLSNVNAGNQPALQEKTRPARDKTELPASADDAIKKPVMSNLDVMLTGDKADAGKSKEEKRKTGDALIKHIEASIPEAKFKGERDKHLLIIIPNKEYLKSIILLSKSLSIQYKKICYVSLNELHEALIKNLKDAGINTNNFFFVDAISRTSQSKIQKVPNAVFISSPNSLVELSLAISDALAKENPDVVLFDSISTLLIYEKGSTSTKFLHSLIGKIKSSRSAAVFTALEGDVNADAVKDLGMFVDEVLTMTEYQLYKMRIGPNESPLIPSAGSRDTGLLSALKDFEMVNVRPHEMAVEQRAPEAALIKMEMQQLQEKIASMQEQKQPQMTKIARKIDQLGKKSPADIVLPGLLRELKEMREDLSKAEKRPVQDNSIGMQKALHELSEKIGAMKLPAEKSTDAKVISAQLGKLSEKISGFERRPMHADNHAMVEQELRELEKKISKVEKGPSLKKYIGLMAKELKKQKPKPFPKAGLRKLEGKLEKIEKRISANEKSKNIELKRQRQLEQRKAGLEEKREDAARQIEGLEKKLKLLNQSYALGVIGKTAYETDKARIEMLLKKGH